MRLADSDHYHSPGDNADAVSRATPATDDDYVNDPSASWSLAVSSARAASESGLYRGRVRSDVSHVRRGVRRALGL